MSTAIAMDIGYAAVIFALGTAILRVSLKRRRPSERERAAAARDRIIREYCEYVPVPPASDNRPGTDAEALDFIELTYGMPAYVDPELEAGCEELWAAIRDEQQKGDQ